MRERATTPGRRADARRPRPTVRDSPVTMLWSISARPSTIVPSAGTRDPGRTSTTSPTCRRVERTASVPASTLLYVCRAGARRGLKPRREPMIAASRASGRGHDRDQGRQLPPDSTVKMPTGAARLAMNATRIARLISVIIRGCRATSSSRAPRRNTRPPIAKTAAAKHRGGMRSLPGNAGGW